MQAKIMIGKNILIILLLFITTSVTSQNINLASDETEMSSESKSVKEVFKYSQTVNDKKYCVSNYKGKYEISLSDDGTHKAYFNLYDNNDRLLKTTQGEWTLRDEGVYGVAHILTFDFTGVNSNMPSMKFTCQYNGSGQLQALIDNQDRTWDMCR